MRTLLVVIGEPGIEVDLQLLDCPIDLLAEGYSIELVQHGAMEALADAIIRYVMLGASASAVPSRAAASMVSPSGMRGTGSTEVRAGRRQTLG
jgi:hypothetical protein